MFILHPFGGGVGGGQFLQERNSVVIQGLHVQYSSPSISEVRNKWRYTFTPHICLNGMCKAIFTFTLYVQFYFLLVVACHCHSSVYIVAAARWYAVLPSPLPTCLKRVRCLQNLTYKKHVLSNSYHLKLFTSLQVLNKKGQLKTLLSFLLLFPIVLIFLYSKTRLYFNL